jgi:hypothetical protein
MSHVVREIMTLKPSVSLPGKDPLTAKMSTARSA